MRAQPGSPRLLLAGVLLLSAGAACSPLRMPVPAELAAAPEMPVRGRDGFRIRQRVRFGEFEAYGIGRGWTRESRPLFSGREAMRQRYHFRLREEETDRWRVECDNREEERTTRVLGVEVTGGERVALDCTLVAAAEPERSWRLVVTSREGDPLSGTLSRGEERFDVRGIDRYQEIPSCCDQTGYQLLLEARPVGTVEIVGRGSVRLDASLAPEERSILAGAAAALLLRDELREG